MKHTFNIKDMSPHKIVYKKKVNEKIFRRRRWWALGLTGGLLIGLTVAFMKFVEYHAHKSKEVAVSSAHPMMSATSAVSPSFNDTSLSCDKSKVKVETMVDNEVYRLDMKPQFTLKITNIGEKSCQLNVGTSQQVFIVFKKSGEKIWSSRDCQVEPTDDIRVLRVGKPEEANLQWQRLLSHPGCTAPQGIPQPGQYTVSASVGDNVSPGADFVLQ